MADPERDTVHRFDNRVDDYAKARPSYPAEAIAAMLRGLGHPPMLTVADVGAGTGIMSRLIADKGPLVVAVEPNEKMRAKAEPYERMIWQKGSAEATGLGDGSVNLVVCAQSFHWFDRPAALAEFKRVLRTVGRLALVWNEVDTDDPLGAVYRRVVDDAADDEAPRRRHAIGANPFEGDTQFCEVRCEVFRYEQVLTVEGLVRRAMSASYAPKDGPKHDEMISALRAAHAEHAREDGTAVLRYRTAVWMAEPRPADAIDLKLRRGE
ncbi:MAG: class I SAM-dependent methyltransferase [Phycisphaeraceae bacterium]|nr:MAG: class I SAM-dependent methyltransferase [Phycisphaeraceae bacterium]